MPNHSFWWSHPSGGIISLSQCLTWRWAHSWIPHHCLRRKKIINNLRERLRTISPKTTFPPCPSMSYYKWVKSGTILILLYCFVKGMTWVQWSYVLDLSLSLNYQIGVGALSFAIWVRMLLHVNVPKWTYTFLNLSFKIYINTYYFLYMIRF